MNQQSLFVSTAVKKDDLTGEELKVTYHPSGLVNSTIGGRALGVLAQPGITHGEWIGWMKKQGYEVETRDATLQEIQKGVAQ